MLASRYLTPPIVPENRAMKFVDIRFDHLRTLWRERVLVRWVASLWALYGVLAAARDEMLSPDAAEKLRIPKLIPQITLAWWIVVALTILLMWVFEASFKVDKKRQSRIAELSPGDALVVAFDPADTRCVRPYRSLRVPLGERYSILLTNRSGRSLQEIAVIAHASWFTSYAIAHTIKGGSVRRDEPVHVFEGESLHPGASDAVPLVDLRFPAGSRNPNDLFSNKQQFSVEVRARDTETVRLNFEYDPDARPMLRTMA
jgi:hypothetical protein